MLNEISQTQKSKYYMIPWLHVVSRIEPESRIVVTSENGERAIGSYCLIGTEFMF